MKRVPTIWWEDQAQEGRTKQYGPNVLLAACVGDVLGGRPPYAVERFFDGQPKKGAGKLLKALRDESNLGSPLCVVFDRDRVLRIFPAKKRPRDSSAEIRNALRAQAKGDYKLVLLDQNLETVVRFACRQLHLPVPDKGNLAARDESLRKLAYANATTRDALCDEVCGWKRIVDWVIAQTNLTTP